MLAIIGWWIFIHTSPFHVTVNQIPGPKFYLPLIGNALDLSGGLDRKSNDLFILLNDSNLSSIYSEIVAFENYRYTQYVSI